MPVREIEQFLGAIPEAIVITDVRGRIAFVNAAAQMLFAYSDGELVGRPLLMLLPESRASQPRRVAGDGLGRRPGGAANNELRARRKDGTEFPAEIRSKRLDTDLGTFVSSTIRDVTERKTMERALVAARDAAEQASRSMSGLLATAGHDLRQPLQTLTLLNQLLEELVPADSEASAAVTSQSNTLRVMADLMDSLLDVSKLEAGVIKPKIVECRLDPVLRRLESEFAPLTKAKGLELDVEFCADVVRSDPTLLGQVLQNLLANAIRYTSSGSVRLRSTATAHSVRIEVEDTGIGIASSELELIFDEFYQASGMQQKAPREGSGLGLSIARRTASLLGCTIGVRSTVGKGSCFSVDIPRAAVGNARLEGAVPRPRRGAPAAVPFEP